MHSKKPDIILIALYPWLNENDKTRHPGFVLNLRWVTLLINYDISCRFIVDAIYPSSIPNMPGVLFRNGFCILPEAFTTSIEKIICF